VTVAEAVAMTEEEWLVSTDPKLMFKCLTWKRASQRKLRMFIREAFLPVYAYLGFLPQETSRLVRLEAELDSWVEVETYVEHQQSPEFTQFLQVLIERTVSKGRGLQHIHSGRWSWDWKWSFECERANGLAIRADAREKTRRANLLRELFCNPFRPVTFNPSWRTSDVLLLAQGISDQRAFDRMPILADALQDAGCDNEDILNHCRDANATHVRGCWVVDLVLGKE
jgi:hypothetical protein